MTRGWWFGSEFQRHDFLGCWYGSNSQWIGFLGGWNASVKISIFSTQGWLSANREWNSKYRKIKIILSSNTFGENVLITMCRTLVHNKTRTIVNMWVEMEAGNFGLTNQADGEAVGRDQGEIHRKESLIISEGIISRLSIHSFLINCSFDANDKMTTRGVVNDGVPKNFRTQHFEQSPAGRERCLWNRLKKLR